MPKLSIVVPVYFNEANLPDTIPHLLSLQDKLAGYNLELIFVDDGSRDKSLETLLDFRGRHPKHIKIVKLTRNFGSMAAVQAGLNIATGDCVGVISADLQDPPELFVDMVAYWEKGIKAVFAVRKDRDESFSQRLFSNTYYAFLRRFAIPDYPTGGFDFVLIDQDVAGKLVEINEKNTNIMSLIFWLGYANIQIPYVRKKRTKGKSRWTFSKKLKLFIDSFVAFSYLPIRLLSLLGILIAAASFVYGGFIFYSWWLSRIEVKGYTPIMILLASTAGIQMTMLGVLGEYLWRILDETRKRPGYVVDTIYE